MRQKMSGICITAVLGSVAALGACTTADDAASSSASPVPPTVFQWSGDDLNQWVTEAEMTAALGDLSRRHTGSDLDGEALLGPREPSDDWGWSAGGWRVSVHDGDHGGSGAVASSADGEVMDLTGADPRLPEGVVYEKGDGFAEDSYILSGPNAEESICITVYPPGTSWGDYDADVRDDVAFGVASMMLREMGWASADS